MLLESIFDFDVLKVLGYGLSGFAFLLMFFAFMLLRQIINKEQNTPAMVIKSIWGFMGLSFLMTICIGIFSFFVSDYKKETLAENKSTIQDQHQKIDIIATDHKRDSVLQEALEKGSFKDAEDFKKVDEKQQPMLDSLEKKLDHSSATTDDKKDFDSLKGQLDHVSGELSKDDLSKKQRDSLTIRYVHINSEISKIPTRVATRNFSAVSKTALRDF